MQARDHNVVHPYEETQVADATEEQHHHNNNDSSNNLEEITITPTSETTHKQAYAPERRPAPLEVNQLFSPVQDVYGTPGGVSTDEMMETSSVSDAMSLAGISEFDTDRLITNYTINSKGCWGFLERIPILFKLACMNSFWFVGMLTVSILLIILRSQILATGVSEQRFSRFVVVAGNLIHDLQKERGSTNLYINSNGTLYLESLKTNRMSTDVSLEQWDDYVAQESSFLEETASSPIMRSAVDTMMTSRNRIEEIRNSVIPDIRVKASFCFTFYTEWVSSLLAVIYSSMGVLNDYSLLVTIKEKAGQERAAGSGMMASNLADLNSLKLFISLVNEQNSLLDIFSKLSKKEDVEYFQSVMTGPETSGILAVEDYLLSIAPGTSIAMNSTVWFENTTAKINKYKKMEDYLAAKMLDDSDIRDSSIYISIIGVLMIVFIACSLILAIIVSKIIIGPWQRMNQMQEDTISKFVPKGFLRLINAKQIVDVEMGTAVSREITALFSDIRDFTSISEKMTPEQNFEFINLYLNEVGPVIRKYGGYIDKFLGDGFMALFTKAKNGMMASIEMQKRIDTFSQETAKRFTKMPIRVGVGVHCGKVIVGTVGENKRMDGSIIGDAVNLTSRLESLTKRYKAKILTTGYTLSRITNSQLQFSYRFLGKVRVKGKEKEVDIFEMLDGSDLTKEKSKDEFSKAVQLMIQCKFTIAKDMFEKILFENPNDYAAELKYQQCVDFLAAGVQYWDGIETITEK